jgi:DNA-binding transcriptional LysR family regulator
LGEHADERANGDFSTPGRSSPIVLQHLQYAVSAAEHGSFRRAAEALLLRQSTVSRCVRKLEESTSLIVVERVIGGVQTGAP